MSQDKIEMNAQTYAAVFECIERCVINPDEKFNLLFQYEQEMCNKVSMAYKNWETDSNHSFIQKFNPGPILYFHSLL